MPYDFPSSPSVDDTTSDGAWRWDGARWVPVESSTLLPTQVSTTSVTATAGQTLFNVHEYSAGYESVYLNGVKMSTPADYAQTSSTSITLTTGALSGSVLEFNSFNSLSVSGASALETTTLTATQGQTAFTVSEYNAGFEIVYVNGTKLVEGSDYTRTSSTVITLSEAADAGDVFEMTAFKEIAVGSDKASKVVGATSGNLAALDTSGDLVDSGSIMRGKNMLINGDFLVWQRGTNGFSNGGYTADRWLMWANGNVPTVEAYGSNGPDGKSTVPFITGTAGNTSMLLTQRLESYHFASIAEGQIATFSGWIYSSVAQTITLSAYGFLTTNNRPDGLDTTDAQHPTISHPGGWYFFEQNYTVQASWIKGVELQVVWSQLVAGEIGALSQMQFEWGTTATAFEKEGYGMTLKKCQRYYEQFYCGMEGYANGVQFISNGYTWTARKRTIPTVSETILGDGGVITGSTQISASEVGFWYKLTSSGSGVMYRNAYVYADAEL